MTGDARLKKKTRQAYGKKRRRPWNAPQKKADNVRVRPSSPDAAEVMHSDDGAQPRAPVVSETVHSPGLSCSTSSDCYVVGSSGTSSNIQDRIDTTFYSVDESAQCARNAASLKASLASQCATERKFKLLDVDLEDDGKENGTEFCIIDLAVIDSLLRLFACPECGEKSVTFSKGKKEYGLCSKLVVTCSSCNFREERFSSPRVADETDFKIRPFEVNLRAMKAINSIGKGATALSDFFAVMNISHRGLHHKTYQSHMTLMKEACSATAAECEDASVARVKELYAEFGNAPGNVDVIYDGTWLTRGHKSHICVGCIIEMYSGLVIDHIVLSNFCLACTTGPKEGEAGRSAWLIQHAPLCQKNVDCNAGQMEVEAALRLFGRSLEKHKLRYTTMLSDGDSRTFHALTENEVYGYIKVAKKDCINHVHKRMGAALRTLVEKKKAQGGSLGGKGRLTQQKIKKITSYYGYALRSHRNDVPGMQRAVLATLKHMSSTDEAPKHDLCPEGPDSWCKYQRAVAKNEKPPPHKESLPDFVSEALEPVFRRLSDGALLERCSDGITQNPSESLHSVIWQQAPKIQHASLRSIERAVAEAVSRFNQGVTKSNVEIAEKLGYSAGYNLVRRSLEKDKTRLQKSQRAHLDSNTAKTRLAQRHKPARDPAYSPGLL